MDHSQPWLIIFEDGQPWTIVNHGNYGQPWLTIVIIIHDKGGNNNWPNMVTIVNYGGPCLTIITKVDHGSLW